MLTRSNIASQDSSSIILLPDLHTCAQAWIEYLVQRSRKRYQGELEQDNSSYRGEDAPSRLWVVQHAATFRCADHHAPVGAGVWHDTEKHKTCLLVDGMRHFENGRDGNKRHHVRQ